MQPETYEKVLNEARYVLNTVNDGRLTSELPNYHEEVVAYIRDNYSSFDGSLEQLKEISDLDKLISSLWRITRVLPDYKVQNDLKSSEVYSVYRGAAPLLMGLFKEATGLKYESWYFIKDPIACERLLKKVVVMTKRREVPTFSIFARHLLFKLLAHKFYSNSKELVNHLAPIRARIDSYLKDTEKLAYYLECPKYYPSAKSAINFETVLGPEVLLYIKDISVSLKKELIEKLGTDRSPRVPYKELCHMMLQYCNTANSNLYYELTINNPLNFDEQLPDLWLCSL